MTDVMSRRHYRACEEMHFRDMNEVIKCCIYTITYKYINYMYTFCDRTYIGIHRVLLLGIMCVAWATVGGPG